MSNNPWIVSCNGTIAAAAESHADAIEIASRLWDLRRRLAAPVKFRVQKISF